MYAIDTSLALRRERDELRQRMEAQASALNKLLLALTEIAYGDKEQGWRVARRVLGDAWGN